MGILNISILAFAVSAAAMDPNDTPAALEVRTFFRSTNEAEFHQNLGKFFPRRTDKNWWWNEIGYPHALGIASVKFGDWLTEEEKSGIIDYMERAPLKHKRTGQNKAWISAVHYYRGRLIGDKRMEEAAIRDVLSTIVVGKGEGPRPDGSFWQHGAQPQWGNYELHFVETAAEFAAYLKDEQRKVLEKLFEAYGWTIYNGFLDVGSLGRQFAPEIQRSKGGRIQAAAKELGMMLGEAKGFKYFPDAAQAVYAGEGWRTTIKMSTAKIIGTESYNGDNAQGALMADGACYFYCRGDEYENVFPLWNWRYIPGVTAIDREGAEKLGTGSKVFNQVDNIQVQGNKLVFELKRGDLQCFKSWEFLESGVKCKGWGITSKDNAHRVVTSVEQCPLRGEVVEKREGEVTTVIHDGKIYRITGGKVKVNRVHRKGNWNTVMKRRPSEAVEGDILEILIDHGIAPVNAEYTYEITISAF